MSKEYLPIRLSHLLRHSSVGAVVRGPEYLMTVKDTREWTARDGSPGGQVIPYVDRIRSARGIEQELREPPIASELKNGQVDGVCVPATRFPAWMRCPRCGLLHNKPWMNGPSGEKPRCQNKEKDKKGNRVCKSNPELEQVPWVMVHRDGHMAEVPWHLLAHRNASGQEEKQCRPDWVKPYLRIVEQGASGYTVKCTRENCGASNHISDFSRVRIPYGENTWRQPWIKESIGDAIELAEILEVNDVRVHDPETSTDLVIPPESRIHRGSVVDRLYTSTSKQIEIDQAKTPLALKGVMKRIASDFRCTVDEVKQAMQEIENGYPLYGQNITQGILHEQEYEALTEVIPDVSDDEDFVTRHYTRAWKSITQRQDLDLQSTKIVKTIDRLIAVTRLKEIMILRGFKRLGGELVPPDIAGGNDWLPALELYGEGIFFTINEEILQRWESEKALIDRARDISRRFDKSGMRFTDEIYVTPRFLMLHTMAHLLIRRLETEAGYPAASLKERIYCTVGKKPMAGILVYVAVPDIVGSLGGIVELADPLRFLNLISSVFDHAEWCSLDPVCSEHEGQGPNLLNRAACHACALVPEPSCAYDNVLLDRVFIKGGVTSQNDSGHKLPALLDFVD